MTSKWTTSGGGASHPNKIGLKIHVLGEPKLTETMCPQVLERQAERPHLESQQTDVGSQAFWMGHLFQEALKP